jgi:hypothetical protein
VYECDQFALACRAGLFVDMVQMRLDSVDGDAAAGGNVFDGSALRQGLRDQRFGLRQLEQLLQRRRGDGCRLRIARQHQGARALADRALLRLEGRHRQAQAGCTRARQTQGAGHRRDDPLAPAGADGLPHGLLQLRQRAQRGLPLAG